MLGVSRGTASKPWRLSATHQKKGRQDCRRRLHRKKMSLRRKVLWPKRVDNYGALTTRVKTRDEKIGWAGAACGIAKTWHFVHRSEEWVSLRGCVFWCVRYARRASAGMEADVRQDIVASRCRLSRRFNMFGFQVALFDQLLVCAVQDATWSTTGRRMALLLVCWLATTTSRTTNKPPGIQKTSGNDNRNHKHARRNTKTTAEKPEDPQKTAVTPTKTASRTTQDPKKNTGNVNRNDQNLEQNHQNHEQQR